MNAHNEQHFTAADMADQYATAFERGRESVLAEQAAAAQEPVAWQRRHINAGDRWFSISREIYEATQNGKWKDRYEVRALYAAPVTAAPGIDTGNLISSVQSMRDRMMAALVPKFGEAFDGDFDTMLEAINVLKRIDASPKGELPALPDDFSESKDWRAGGYAERIEWLLDTVRNQREHINALLDSPEGGSEAIRSAIAGLEGSVAVGSDGEWVSVRRYARDAAVKVLRDAEVQP